MSRKWKTGSGECTFCGRRHPKGKKQKERAMAKGWVPCKTVAIRRARAASREDAVQKRAERTSRHVRTADPRSHAVSIRVNPHVSKAGKAWQAVCLLREPPEPGSSKPGPRCGFKSKPGTREQAEQAKQEHKLTMRGGRAAG